MDSSFYISRIKNNSYSERRCINMKIILDKINYKGKHFDHVEIGIPDHVGDLDKLPEGKLVEYIADCLDTIIEQGES